MQTDFICLIIDLQRPFFNTYSGFKTKIMPPCLHIHIPVQANYIATQRGACVLHRLFIPTVVSRFVFV